GRTEFLARELRQRDRQAAPPAGLVEYRSGRPPTVGCHLSRRRAPHARGGSSKPGMTGTLSIEIERTHEDLTRTKPATSPSGSRRVSSPTSRGCHQPLHPRIARPSLRETSRHLSRVRDADGGESRSDTRSWASLRGESSLVRVNRS